MTGDFDRSVVDSTAHRPWPMPTAPWLMTQTWNDLLFAHWRVDPSQLRRAVPERFELDLFEGEAWVSVVPFSMTNVGLRGLPALPCLSAFPELNLRTYVRVGQRPGVYFFSLDAARRLAVATARALLNLPYHAAAMRVRRRGDAVHFQSTRRSRDRASFEAIYEPVSPPAAPSVGSLEYFLTERYCLYHYDRRRRPYRLEIHHRPWPLQLARASITINTVAAANHLTVDRADPLLHFAARHDVVAWAPSGLSDRGSRSVRNVTE